MKSFFLNRTTLIIIILGLFGVFLFLYLTFRNKPLPAPPLQVKSENLGPEHKVIGTSVEGREINAYTYGNGQTHLAFVGGIHGGYEWNSAILAYKFMDYLEANPEVVPENMTVTVIPSANPDGIYKVIGKDGRFTVLDIPKGSTVSGRFNANKVDLNRNFDCKWKPESTWRENIVSGGRAAFSEPEAVAIRDFVLENHTDAVVFWHSQGNAVYASECENGILPETLNIMNVYSKASGYPAIKTFDSYETSGDAEGWLAKIGTPSITVELKTHETIEWEQNLLGIKALFEYYR